MSNQFTTIFIITVRVKLYLFHHLHFRLNNQIISNLIHFKQASIYFTIKYSLLVLLFIEIMSYYLVTVTPMYDFNLN